MRAPHYISLSRGSREDQICDKKLEVINQLYVSITENPQLNDYSPLVNNIKRYIRDRTKPGEFLGEDLTLRLDYIISLFSTIREGDPSEIAKKLEDQEIQKFQRIGWGTQRLYDILVKAREQLREVFASPIVQELVTISPARAGFLAPPPPGALSSFSPWSLSR